MHKPKYWEKAKKDLILKDKKLGKIILNYPKDFLYSKSDPFYTISRSIVGQQISVVAAQAIWNRLEKKVTNITPKKLNELHHMTLKSCGLSRQKISYLKSLSKAFLDNSINPKDWPKLSDDEVINQLVKVRGIGKWTAEMYLIFNLCRPDIFPVDEF